MAGRPSPIRWSQDNGIEALGLVPDTFSRALGVSHDGSVIAGQYNDLPFLWTEAGGVVTVSEVGATRGNFFGLSDNGMAAAGFLEISGIASGYRWDTVNGYSDLGETTTPRALSFDGSVIIGDGRLNNTANAEAFRWTEETGVIGLGDLRSNDFRQSRAFGVTPDGAAVVGFAATDSGPVHAYLWTEERGMHDLAAGGTFESTDSTANDLTADAKIVVGTLGNTDIAAAGAIIWSEQTGLLRLDDWLTAVGLGQQIAGWNLTQATGISDDGLTIVGDGINPRGDPEGWVVQLDPVPEPNTTVLGCLALLASLFVRIK